LLRAPVFRIARGLGSKSADLNVKPGSRSPRDCTHFSHVRHPRDTHARQF
jgi:hypothetical protein